MVTTPNPTKRPISPGAEALLGVKSPVLDKGYVILVDYEGNDDSIAEAARASYGSGTIKVHENAGLIRYLMRHRHTTPFEMVGMKFELQFPISVERQHNRHRTASINEESTRYSVIDAEFYEPEIDRVKVQSKTNRQGSGDSVDIELAEQYRAGRKAQHDAAKVFYDDAISLGLARELVRDSLPLSTYTHMFWKMNLHNLFHYLSLRMDSHAQWEIRQYANAMAEIVKQAFPIAWQAFVDYQLEAKLLTGPEANVLKDALISISWTRLAIAFKDRGLATNQRERWETLEKLASLGLISKLRRDNALEHYLRDMELSGNKRQQEASKLDEMGLVYD